LDFAPQREVQPQSKDLVFAKCPPSKPAFGLGGDFEKFRAADDPAQVKRMGDELGRFVFGE
jgi:hypothetical protein